MAATNGTPLCLALAAAAAVAIACGGHRPASIVPAAPPSESLESYIARVRVLSSEARVRPVTVGQTIEMQDPQLRDALLEVRAGATAERHRRVAIEYRRLGILDMAHAHFTSAVRMNPKDAISHEALARIWRDWGFAYLGLGNAWNAVYFAPESPAAANTMGTIFDATGQLTHALRWYERALALDANAVWALNNICYALIRLRSDDAIAACERTVNAEPKSPLFRNNLALAYAAAGQLDRAREQFAAASDPASTAFNMGIVRMAQRDYPAAVQEFHAALRAQPTLADAAVRARQAREAASQRRQVE